MSRLLAREWARFAATPRLWWFTLLLPVMLPGLLLLIFIEQVPDQLPVAVVDQDQSAGSRQLVRALDGTPGLRIAAHLPDMNAAASRVRQGDVYAVIVVPRDFAREVIRAEQPRIQLYYNRQTLTAGNLVLREVRTAVTTTAIGIGMAQGALPAVLVESHALFNPGLEFGRFLALPLAVAVLHVLMVVLAIDVTGRELRDGSAGDWLDAAGGGMVTALLGKLLPYMVWFFVFGLLLLAVLLRLLGTEFKGSLIVWILGWLGLVLASFGLGAFLLGLLGNLRLATSVASVLVSPAFAYSGMTFPTAAMDGFAAFWAQALPLGYFLHLQSAQVLMAAPPAAALWHVFALLLFALLPVLTLRRWRRWFTDPDSWGQA
ncbi:MAG: ABC transporter permease [Chromatiaceae bacterium]|nr:MAG: ABC transporter permease [Chromatiaceae bacterium]